MRMKNVLVIVLITMFYFVPFSVSTALSKTTTNVKQMSSQVTEKININKAGVEELSELPGIGTKKAEAIQSYIKDNGKLKNIEDLLNVKGIGPKVFEKISPYVTVT